MTQLEAARAGIITEAMRTVAADEGLTPEEVRAAVASGKAVIPLNVNHKNVHPMGVGRMFRTKVNANLGRSPTCSGKGDELDKLAIALKAGADFVMDLSVGAEITAIRQGMLDATTVPLGTVPVYETLSRAPGDIPVMDPDLLLHVIEEQAKQGVDFMTLHAGLLLKHIPLAKKRVMGIVSRGGAIMAEWMQNNNAENPLYTRWDEVCAILRQYDVTVSLGDGLRSGCLADASDAAQFGELSVLGELVKRTRAAGVQVMVEGPGHIPFNEVQMNMAMEQELCDGAPFYVLGPIVIDIAPGYDHIVSAIGATAAATYGASLLCYVTPSEHLGLPNAQEVHEGMIAYKIAAHAGDVARGFKGAADQDLAMAKARRAFNWEAQFKCALDPEHARKRWQATRAEGDREKGGEDYCSMCGKAFCAVRTSRRIMGIGQ